MIILCLTTANYNVIQDGTTVGPIVPSKGLRQGDPFSPYLFILCAKRLSSLIRKNERAGKSRSAPIVSYFLLLINANQREASLIKNMLAMYGTSLG